MGSSTLYELLAALCAGLAMGLIGWTLLRRPDPLGGHAEVLEGAGGPRHQAPREDMGDRIEKALARAGWAFRLRELVLMWAGITLAVAVVFGVLSHQVIAGVLVGPVAATAGLYWAVKISEVRRRKLLDEQLVRVLYSLSGMLQAGRTEESAIEEAAKTVGPPLGPELTWVADEYSLSGDLSKALRAAAQRLGSKEFSYFATAVEVHQEKGGDIVNVLGKLSGSVSEHIALRGERRAVLAQMQMTRHIASVAPIGATLLVWIASPSTLSLAFKSATGIEMLGLAALLWAIGFVVIGKLTSGLDKEL